MTAFRERLARRVEMHRAVVERPNRVDPRWHNGIFDRYVDPVVEAEHVPLSWRYDLDERTNPLLLERLGINCVFNPGALCYQGKIVLMCRVEGVDRKSFFAVAESDTGIDGFRFWNEPVQIPALEGDEDTNVYDMRLTEHQDGYIYGVFCSEKPDPNNPGEAWARAGIVRTRDLKTWERLPNLETPSRQQRNAVLHPEFVSGKYAFYTRPQDSFLATSEDESGIGWGLVRDITRPVVENEKIIDERYYHSIKDSKNGQGPAPIKTKEGWLHIAHGVRGCAAGLRYTIYAFMTELDDPSRPLYQPGGHLIAPLFDERVGDVSNVVFINGWAQRGDQLFMYYGSSDTRIHVATSSVERLVDYCRNTPPDGRNSAACAEQRRTLAQKNRKLIAESDDPMLKSALR
jgi:4-O-beta-D-mannosyl-D-glucose phosphorylase